MKYVKLDAQNTVVDVADQPKQGYLKSQNDNIKAGDKHDPANDQGQGNDPGANPGQGGQPPGQASKPQPK